MKGSVTDGEHYPHKAPARIRYKESHPTVSCGLSRDVHDLLKERLEKLGGVSFADFINPMVNAVAL